jgi:hypothetical protein
MLWNWKCIFQDNGYIARFLIETSLNICMKKILCFALLALVFFAIGICTAEIPDLQGNWTGSWIAYDDGIGYSNLTENGSFIIAFSDQNGRIFSGNITYMEENDTIDEGFAGAIGLDNKTLYIAEFDKGYATGTMISSDEMELIYLEDGNNGTVAIDKLYRIKE